MQVDIRTPIGGMFAVIGALLVVYGLATAGKADMYQASLGVNVNFWWGAAMLAFGAVMLYFGRRGQTNDRPR